MSRRRTMPTILTTLMLVLLAYGTWLTPLHAASINQAIAQQLPQPQTAYVPIDLEFSKGSTVIHLQRIDFWSGQVVFVGTARSGSDTECMSRDEFTLYLDNVAYGLQSRDTTHQNYGIYGPGNGFFTICLSPYESVTLLLPFSAPVTDVPGYLVFDSVRLDLPSSLEGYYRQTVAAAPTPTSTPTPTPTPTATPAAASVPIANPKSYALPIPLQAKSLFISGIVSDQGIQFSLEHIDFWTELPDKKSPRKDIFVVMTGILEPAKSGSSDLVCVGGGDVVLISGHITYAMDNMRSAKTFYNTDFPGYILPQCVKRVEPTFFVFDVFLDADPLTLRFHNAQLELGHSVAELYTLATASVIPSTPTPTNLILNVPPLIGMSVEAAEAILGPPEYITDIRAGALTTVRGPSVIRTYTVNGVTFDATFDSTGTLRVVQLIAGISEDSYRMDQWPLLFPRLGLPNRLPKPDIKEKAWYKWRNVDGLTIEIFEEGDLETGSIWSVLVYVPPDRPAPTRTVPVATTVLETPTPKPVVQARVRQNANLRAGPGTGFQVIGGLKAGDSITVVATDPSGEWIALADGSWIAAFLVEPVSGLPTTTPSPTPSPTATADLKATIAAQERAAAQATLTARVYNPPDGTWCAQTYPLAVCVGDFRYLTSAGYSDAAKGSRFVAFGIYVKNLGRSTTHVNPYYVTMVMADGRTYAHDIATYGYWSQPLDAVDIVSGAAAEGGLVFLVPSNVAPERIIYRTFGLVDNDITIDLRDAPVN